MPRSQVGTFHHTSIWLASLPSTRLQPDSPLAHPPWRKQCQEIISLVSSRNSIYQSSSILILHSSRGGSSITYPSRRGQQCHYNLDAADTWFCTSHVVPGWWQRCFNLPPPCITTLCPFGNPVANISLVTNSLSTTSTDVDLRLRKVQANASPRPFRKRHKMPLAKLERRLICGKPSFWVEDAWIGEDIFIVVHQVAALKERNQGAFSIKRI
jgi:hypothetical protein